MGRAHGESLAAPAALRARLEARRGEIEQAARARVLAIADPAEAPDPAYAAGLRAALGAALDFGIERIGAAVAVDVPMPPALLVQARMAARNGIGLDTVMRRYFGGYSLLVDAIVEEAQGVVTALDGPALQRLLRSHAALFERLLAAVSEEYARERRAAPRRAGERRAELARRLLGGESLDPSELAYDLEAHHLGLVASGPGAAAALRGLRTALDCRALVASPEEGTAWAWLGARRPPDPERAMGILARCAPALTVACGEPAAALAGWRLTHRQAAAAHLVAVRSAAPAARYRDVALLASALENDLLSASLRRIYIDPLAGERDGGATLKATLRAYFAAARSAAAAAAKLGVTRQTVNNHLRTVEQRLQRPLGSWASELELALQVEELGLAFPDRKSTDPRFVASPNRSAMAPRDTHGERAS